MIVEMLYLLLFVLPSVFGQIVYWDADYYWNIRYSLGYTTTDTNNGMWSNQLTSPNGYTKIISGVPSCSACDCINLKNTGILRKCAGDVSIQNYNFPNISSKTFDVGTTTISIRSCGAFDIEDETFVNLTSLTKLTIESSGITTMPDISRTRITELNLMYNKISINSTYKGTLPATITHVALTSNKIYWIPDGFLKGPNLRSVSLGGNLLVNFPVSGFGSIPSLIYFGIENNQIRRLSAEHMNNFVRTTQLHLNFTNNVIDYIQPYAFKDIPNLKVLELGGNSFSTITKGVFEKLPELVHLDLHGNKIQTLNAEALIDLEKLQELRLHSQNPKMTTIIFNSMINIGKSLKYLFVSSNALTHVPHQVFMENNFPVLDQLHCDNNGIINVTELDEKGYGPKLRSTYNEKKTVLAQKSPFSTMKNVRYLFLQGNFITNVTSTDYCKLTSLLWLYLNSNQLKEYTIDENAFTCVPTLDTLHLGSNFIQYVPKALKSGTRMPKIRVLYLIGNKLTFIEKGTFIDLRSLRILDLDSNKIISVEDNSFPSAIQEIHMSGNDFRFIHENQFSSLASMFYLNLGFNDIDYIPDRAFIGCKALTQLFLESNKIKQIKKVHLQNSPLTTYLYLSNNQIGWIEDGALDHISSLALLHIGYNRLYNLPMGGDFRDIEFQYFFANNNRFSSVLNGTFKNFRVISVLGGNLDLQNNRIATIERGAFLSVTTTNGILLGNNKIKDIQPYAFTDVSASSIDFGGNPNMGIIQSYTFNNIRCTSFSLANSGITEIKAYAFNNFAITSFNLDGNSISSLNAPLFGGSSSVQTLSLKNNGITYITADVFENVTVNYLYITNNSLTVYPIALSKIKPIEIYLENNEITGFPHGSLDEQSNLKVFSMFNNQLTEIKADLFSSATNLQIISFTNNALGCECSTAYSLFHVKDTSTGGSCVKPNALAGVSFEASAVNSPSSIYYTTVNESLFQCSAENIVATAVSPTELKVEWTRPTYLYAVFDTNNTVVQVAALAPNVTTWIYTVICTSTTAATLTQTTTITVSVPSTSHNGAVTFTDADGLLPLNFYDCVIQLDVDGYVSARSIPVTVYVQDTATNSTESSGWLNVTVYDFTISNDDFGSKSSVTPTSPYHVTSPTGSWPAISTDPTSSTFSDWFRDTSSNIVLERGISLTVDNSSGSTIYSYYSDSYFLADGAGYGAEGQTDCHGILHNFFFTSAIRTGLKFSGKEKMTFGGGEELWVFINKVLVIEIIANRTSTNVTCQTIDLSPAAALDGGNITAFEGTVVGGVCTSLSPLASSFALDLQIGDSYLFEIFHVERAGCSSELLIDLQNVYLTNHDGDDEPMHFKFTASEDLNINGLIGQFSLWDMFTSGPPFNIELYKGNEARHFTFKDNSVANLNAGTTTVPPTYSFVNVTGTSLQYVACTGSTKTPDPVNTATETFTVTTSQVLLTLATMLDYEVAQSYNLVFRVIDTKATKTGSLVVKVAIVDVNDNCPIMNITEEQYFTTKRPLLQPDPLLVISASDADSGINKEFQFHVSKVILESPSLDYSKALAIREQVYNGSTNVTVEVVVIDLGNPPHGSVFNVTVNLSNTCLIDELFDRTNITFVINTTGDYGQFYLRIPGYWIVDFKCDDFIGISNGIVRDELITASSYLNDQSQPGRARLNLTDNDPVNNFACGWKAGINDGNQYIQVDMEDPYQFTKFYLQGQCDEPNWVTAFRIYYTDDPLGNWTLYQDSTGEFIFLGNIDNNSTRTLDLKPPILSRYVRINPQNWTGSIALRMEFAGCSQAEQFHYDYTCERCYTSYYCLGDGEAHTCGRCIGSGSCDRSPTEHSFGAAGECSPCPKGWICKAGVATPCDDYHYVNCTDESCPSACSHCDPGYACRGGQSYICDVGTYSDGNSEYCSPCSAGTYQDVQGRSACKNCEAGFYSASSKDRCNPCDVGSYSLGDGSEGCTGCQDAFECPCMGNETCFSAGEYRSTCVNTGSASYKCLDCPLGFTGNGMICADIDECALFRPCWDPAACINTVPGYQCSACPYGYTGSYEDALARNLSVHLRVFEYESMNHVLSTVQKQRCTDIDECERGLHICDVHSECINTIGSYQCGFCNEGYAGVSTHKCYSTNYCATGEHKCHSLATCIYLRPKEYKCQCPIGYAGNGRQCGLDSDLDGHPDITIACTDWGCYGDNCRTIPNCGQEDVDNDNMGDDCDDDKDNDGRINSIVSTIICKVSFYVYC